MSKPTDRGWSRRKFLRAGAIAGAGAMLGTSTDLSAAELPLETTRIRVIEHPDICAGTPLIVAQELLVGEGFADLQTVREASGLDGAMAVSAGEADITVTAAPPVVTRIDAGEPLVLLAGIHVGCFELFATERIRSLRDLKGKEVAVTQLGSGGHLFLAMMLKHVGLDPRADVKWVTDPAVKSLQFFADGKIDAFMGYPPDAGVARQEDWPHHRQHDDRQTLVAVLLLHGDGEP